MEDRGDDSVQSQDWRNGREKGPVVESILVIQGSCILHSHLEH